MIMGEAEGGLPWVDIFKKGEGKEFSLCYKIRWGWGWKTLIFCAFTQKSDFKGRRGSQKNNIEGGLPKKGTCRACRFKGGTW